jgi:hypothetical protein
MQNTTSEVGANRLRLQGLWEFIPGLGLLFRLAKLTPSKKFNDSFRNSGIW